MESLIVFGILGVLVVYIISVYNKIVQLKESATNAEKQISVQLDRRAKIFDSLINAVSKIMDFEKGTLVEVVELRNKAINLGNNLNNDELKSIEDQLSRIVSSGELTSSLNLTMEAYPELKSNQNMMLLQEEIVSTENKLSFAKQGFNDVVEKYNSTIKSFPDIFIVQLFSSLKEEFKYWDLSVEQIKKEEERRVSF